MSYGNNNRKGETSTFVRDDSIYKCISFSEFLKENTKILSLGRNTHFENTNVLQLFNGSNSLLKIISISSFVCLFKELPHPEVNSALTCTTSKNILLDIFYKVHSSKI